MKLLCPVERGLNVGDEVLLSELREEFGLVKQALWLRKRSAEDKIAA